MKSLIAGLLIISGLQIAKADELVTNPPVGQAIVELRITHKPFGAAENARTKPRKERLMGQSVCSGSFIDSRGDIITAGHCAANAEEIEVITYDQRSYKATIIATSSVHDLALLHIDRRNTAHFNPAPSVTRGETIFVQGSPLGIPDVLTTGVVAKLAGDIILVDCGVLPGNSGSAVFNTKGEMVGVAVAGYIVGMGTTHLNLIQGIDSVWFFIEQAFRNR